MRIKELDGLRGIAVLAVISEHYMSWLPAVGSQYGWLGVDLFFILSGFLITSILLELRDKEHYFKVFYSRRALRIFPPYFLGIFVYLGISFALGRPGTWGLWLQYIFYYTSLFVGQPPVLHLVPSIIPTAVVLGLGVLWSLSVEEIYYTIWAPVVRYTSQKGFTAILAGMIVAAPLLRWWLHTPDYPELYTFYCRMDGLAYGSAIALLLRERRLAPGKWMRSDTWFDRAALLVLPVTVAFWLITRGERGSLLVVTVGLVLADLSFALLAHALIRRAGGNQLWVRLFRAKWLRSIGMVSYSLYLFHYPLRTVSIDLVMQLRLSRHASAIASVLLGLVLSFGVAYGLWYLMESRILRWKDRKVPSPAHPEVAGNFRQ
jgi:peptidoglycan/LPS O-acetylase OafA/YrhL